MQIGDRIKKRRLELGYSVEKVAKLLNKNRATIYRYENNEIENFPTTILEPLAEVLKTTPAHLMGWEEKKESDHPPKIPDRFDSAEEAMKFILEQPQIMAYGGYDLNTMSDEEIISFANDILYAVKLAAERHKRNKR